MKEVHVCTPRWGATMHSSFIQNVVVSARAEPASPAKGIYGFMIPPSGRDYPTRRDSLRPGDLSLVFVKGSRRGVTIGRQRVAELMVLLGVAYPIVLHIGALTCGLAICIDSGVRQAAW